MVINSELNGGTMDLAKRFEVLHEKARLELAGVAKSAPPETLAKILSVIEACERARGQITDLEGLANRLEIGAQGKQNSVVTVPVSGKSLVTAPGQVRRSRPGKSEGKAERRLLLQQAQKAGAVLRSEGMRLYRTVSGKRVGIGFATEDRRGDLWWLGVPDVALDVAILLCKSSAGERLYFMLSSDFLSKIRPFLSTNRNDLIFHVRQSGSSFELADAPQSGVKPLNEFRDRYDLLR
jgi:hypothetical protein